MTALGRDGSPSRPFASRVSDLIRLNGGLGEPALPRDRTQRETGDRKIGLDLYPKLTFRSPHEFNPVSTCHLAHVSPRSRASAPERRFHQLIGGRAGTKFRERGADALVGVDGLKAKRDERS